MLINSMKEIDTVLERCKAIPASDVREGGNFYKVKAQDFKFPDGTVQTREYLDKKKSSLVVPITKEGNVIFVVQPISLSKEGVLLEFPAGYWELDEDGITAGSRELAEETGYEPERVIPLGEHYQDPGSIKQTVSTYLALGCIKTKEQELDEGEYIIYIETPYELAIELMDNGYIKDANSYIAFSKTDRIISKNYTNENNGKSIK